MRQIFCVRAAMAALTLAALPAFADVTLRYKTDFKMNPTLPAAMAQQATAGMMGMPGDTTTQLKGGNGASSYMGMGAIYNFGKQEITLLDPDGKRYSTLPASKFADEMMAAMPAIPDQAKAAMAAMKTHVDSKATGKTAIIQGIEGEERQMEITMDAPPMPNVPQGPMMRMVMHIWTAKASEVMRVPAVREVAGYHLFANATMNPLATMQKTIGQQMPGFSDAFSGMMKEMQAGGTPMFLRMQFEMYMPMIAAMMKANPGASPFGADFDTNAPFMTMNQELAEISTASIPDSVFQIPEGYTAAPAADILKDMIARMQAGKK